VQGANWARVYAGVTALKESLLTLANRGITFLILCARSAKHKHTFRATPSTILLQPVLFVSRKRLFSREIKKFNLV